MPGLMIEVGATMMCPHGGTISITPGNQKVMLGGKPASSLADTFPISGCPFMVGTAPQPCVIVQWLTQATKVLLSGQPAILDTSSGLCKSGIPQGTANVQVTQQKAKGQ